MKSYKNTTTNFLTKKFYFNLWIFDLSLKSNKLITKIEHLPTNFKISITLPLLPFYADGSNWIKLIYNALRLISLFSKTKANLSNFLTIQKNKKWQLGAIITSWNYSNNNFFFLANLSLIIFPYIKISEGLNKFNLLSDTTGNLSFSIKEIAYFSNQLDEQYIGWNKSFLVNLFLNLPKNTYSIPFINNKLNWLIWSSLSLKCIRGHGGFLENSFVSKLYKTKKNNSFSRNYII